MDAQLIQALIQHAIEPTLDPIARVLNRPAAMLARFFSQGVPGTSVGLGCPQGSSGETLDGEIRVEVRPSSVPGRSLFVAEAVLMETQSLHGYSGYVLKGEVHEEGGRFVVKRKSKTNRYNVWNWTEVRGR